jgi:hypothetical protein
LSGEKSRLPVGAADTMLAVRAAEYTIEARILDVVIDGGLVLRYNEEWLNEGT